MSVIEKFNADADVYAAAYEAAGLSDMVRAVRAMQVLANAALNDAIADATAPKKRGPAKGANYNLTDAERDRRRENMKLVNAARLTRQNGVAP